MLFSAPLMRGIWIIQAIFLIEKTIKLSCEPLLKECEEPSLRKLYDDKSVQGGKKQEMLLDEKELSGI